MNRKYFLLQIMFFSCILILINIVINAANAESQRINAYYGKYDITKKTIGFPSETLTGPLLEDWPESVPKKKYHIGVLMPHMQDSFWITANYGIISYAKQIGIKITLFVAGGYRNIGNQKDQLSKLVNQYNVDGIIISSVHYTKLDKFIQKISEKGIPVVGLINDIRASSIKAKSVIMSYELGWQAGKFLTNTLDSIKNKPIKISIFPGPKNSGWADSQYNGFCAGVSSSKISSRALTILNPQWGDTRPKVQKMRLKNCLNRLENHGIDYIVGNAVAATEAVTYLKQNRKIHPKAKIVSIYITTNVYKCIKKGTIEAAPSAQIIPQCKIAIDMLVRILNGEEAGKDFPFRASPVIPIITKDNIEQFNYEKLFGSVDFKPIFEKY